MLDRSLYVDLIGKPWEKHARGPSSFDCVGLLLELCARRGLRVALLASDISEIDRASGSEGEWEKVASPLPGDALLISSSDPRWHVGVAISSYLMIHSKQGVGVAVERFDTPLYASRVKGFYRWARESGR